MAKKKKTCKKDQKLEKYSKKQKKIEKSFLKQTLKIYSLDTLLFPNCLPFNR